MKVSVKIVFENGLIEKLENTNFLDYLDLCCELHNKLCLLKDLLNEIPLNVVVEFEKK